MKSCDQWFKEADLFGMSSQGFTFFDFQLVLIVNDTDVTIDAELGLLERLIRATEAKAGLPTIYVVCYVSQPMSREMPRGAISQAAQV